MAIHKPKKVKVRFECNAGHTVESVEVDIYDNIGESEDDQIQKEFLNWLDNNEQCGWEKL